MKNKLVFSITLGLIAAMLLSNVAFAAVWTDQPDYAPGSVVTISGDNSDNAGFVAGETVHVDVAGPNGYTDTCDGIANDYGAWSCQVTLWDSDLAIGGYFYVAIGQISGTSQIGTFTDDAPVRKYSASITPNSDTVGHTLSAYTLTIINDASSTQSLGSANITVPSGYSLVVLGTVTASSDKTWTAALASGVIQLRSNANANKLVAGESVSLNLTATSPSSAASYIWVTQAAQSTDGSSMGNFTREGSDPTVTITGSSDTTAPTAFPTQSPAANANGWNNTNVTITWNWSDNEGGSGIDASNCTLTTEVTTEGTSTVTAYCKDMTGNTGSASYTVKIDKTAPLITWDSDISEGNSFYFWFVPDEPKCSAEDATSGVDGDCIVTGYSTVVGPHTLTATAYDKAGNKAEEKINYEVLAWDLLGFYQPVDMGETVWNTVKGGSTVPLKFEVFAGETELTSTSAVSGFTAVAIACPISGYVADAIEVTVTGGTSLRYDLTAGQFIYNWQTPKKAGSCYVVTMTTQDGSTLSANFKLK